MPQGDKFSRAGGKYGQERKQGSEHLVKGREEVRLAVEGCMQLGHAPVVRSTVSVPKSGFYFQR